jgi:hypothetical protein
MKRSPKEIQKMKINAIRGTVVKMVRKANNWPTPGLNQGGDGPDGRGPSDSDIWNSWLQLLGNRDELRQAWIDAISRALGADPAEITEALARADATFVGKSRQPIQTVEEATEEARHLRAMDMQNDDIRKSAGEISKADALQALDDRVEELRGADESTADAYGRVLGYNGDALAKSLYGAAKRARPALLPGGVAKRRYS